jgi:predicted MPP superfamily phosphohydrolase
LPLTRRQFLATSALGATGLALAGAGALYHDTTDLQVTRLEVRLQRLPSAFDGLRLVQLSDFHYDPYLDNRVIASAVALANQLRPDVVVLTGDFVTQRPFSGHFDPPAAVQAEPCSQLLSGLRPRLGIFAILGNHDYFTDPDRIAAILRAHGFHVLRNHAFPLEENGARLWMAGVNDVVAGADDLGLALQPVPSGEAVVLLAHEPDFADWVPPQRVDLQLSGHSHGGQIVLPIIGPPYLPPLARKYPWGLRRLGPLTLYTNRGIGTITLPVRFNAPPEVTLFTLRAANSI